MSTPSALESGTNENDEIYDSDDDSAIDIASAAAEEDPTPDLTAESSAKKCTKCEKLKKAPRGKKIAWRNRTENWMYVHKDAPDDDGPPEKQDDDEPLPGGEIERKTAAATTVEVTKFLTTNEQRQQSDNAEDAQIANNGNDAAPAETDALDASDNASPRPSQETIVGTEEIPDQQPVPPAAQENVEATKSVPLVGETGAIDATTQEQMAQGEGSAITEGALLDAESQYTPYEPLVTAGADAESRKRQNESEHEASAPKKARVHIDLPVDDDDDTVVVKRERADATERRASAREDVEDVEHDLEELQLQRRILEIELQEVKLRRKLAASRAQGENKRKFNDGTVIKIED
jgi:hypothetical protein